MYCNDADPTRLTSQELLGSQQPNTTKCRNAFIADVGRVARKKLGNRFGNDEAVEEVVQEVMYRLLRSSDYLTLREWHTRLCEMAVKVAQEHLKAFRRQETSWEVGPGKITAGQTSSSEARRARVVLEEAGGEHGIHEMERIINAIPGDMGRIYRLYNWEALGKYIDEGKNEDEPPVGRREGTYGFSSKQIARLYPGVNIEYVLATAQSWVNKAWRIFAKARSERAQRPGRRMGRQPGDFSDD